mmetsp:Transcript_13234/g.28479  ORF Transcript_13234/g.28479 Transcript_13234/m.28479 type:complete len:219 (+) Transcript_13234:338-994(+)
MPVNRRCERTGNTGVAWEALRAGGTDDALAAGKATSAEWTAVSRKTRALYVDDHAGGLCHALLKHPLQEFHAVGEQGVQGASLVEKVGGIMLLVVLHLFSLLLLSPQPLLVLVSEGKTIQPIVISLGHGGLAENVIRCDCGRSGSSGFPCGFACSSLARGLADKHLGVTRRLLKRVWMTLCLQLHRSLILQLQRATPSLNHVLGLKVLRRQRRGWGCR